MRSMGRRTRNHDLTDDAARSAVSGGSGGMATALLSALALLFSGLSLYETVLKRASLRIYVPQVVHYGRDGSGDQELFAIPITIANHGARDAAVTAIRMTVRAKGSPAEKAKEFYGAWFVDAAFFAKGKGFNTATRRIEKNPRPKQPFAPIAVAGRGAYTGTVLFNVIGKTFPQAVPKADSYELTIRLESDLTDDAGVTDRFLATQSEPITMTMKLPYLSRQSLALGSLARMYDTAWDQSKAAPPSGEN